MSHCRDKGNRGRQLWKVFARSCSDTISALLPTCLTSGQTCLILCDASACLCHKQQTKDTSLLKYIILHMPKCDVTLCVKYFKFLFQIVNQNTFSTVNVPIIIIIIITISVPYLCTCLLNNIKGIYKLRASKTIKENKYI